MISTDQANYDGDYAYAYPYGGKRGVSRQKTMSVGSFQANAWGLHDMHGNVRQWCQDWFGDDFQPKDMVDPQGLDKGTSRVLRGGSWYNNPRIGRSAGRGWFVPDLRHSYVGFRLCFSVQ